MPTIAELTAVIRAEAAPFVKGLQDSARGLDAFRKQVTTTSGALTREVTAASTAATSQLGQFGGATQQVSNLMAQAGVNTGILGRAIGALTSPLGLAASAVVGLGLALQQSLASMADQAREIRQLQSVTGQGVEATDNLADTFKLLGFESGALTGSLFRMSQEIESGGETLRLLGLSVRDSSGALKAEGDLFLEIRDAISGMGSAAQRNAALMDIFGRAGRELAPIFALSRAEFLKWREEASKLSAWTEESQKAAQEYSISVNKLGLAWGDFWNQAGAAMAGPATGVLNFLTTAIQKTKEWTAALRERVAAGEGLGGMRLPSSAGGELFGEEPGGGPGGGPAIAPISLAALKAIEEFRKQLLALRADQADQPIVKINQAFAEFSAKHGPAAAAQMRPLVAELIGLTRAAQAAPAQLAAMKATIGDVSEALGEAQLLLDLQNVDDALAALSVTLGANADQVRKDADAWREDQEAIERVAAALAAYVPLAEGVPPFGGADFTQHLIDVNRELQALQATTDLDADSIRKFGVSFALLDAKTQASLLSLRQWNTEAGNIASAKAHAESLAAIERQAALLGPSYDKAEASAGEFQRRILELQAIKNPTGEILAEVDQLKAKFADTRAFIEWRDMFQDVFSSVGNAINTLVQGVILGTTTMADAFKRLGQSIVIEFVNRVIQQALNPLMKAAAQAVAMLFSGGGGSATSASTGLSGDQAFAQSPEGLGLSGGTGGGFNLSSIPSGLLNPNLWSSMGTTVSGIWTWASSGGATLGPAFTGVTSADILLAGGGVSDAMTALTGASTGLSLAFAGVGAAVAAFGSIMDLVGGQIESGIGGIVGGIAGAGIGAWVGGPIGAFIGYALGDLIGSWLGGLFGGGPSNYELKRIAAADEANAALGTVGGGYQAALNSGDIAQILAALAAGGGGGSGNSVRTELVLPSSIAEQIGITGQQIGDQIVAQWSSLTLEQFQQVIAAFREQPELLQLIRGSGDVPYLSQEDAATVAEQIRQGAIALLTAFQAMETVRDKIRTLADDLAEVASTVLPPDIAEQFSEERINPIRDRMLDVLKSGLPVEEMQKQLEALGKELDTWVGLLGLYSQVTQDIAVLSDDLATQTRGAVLGIEAVLGAAADAVERAQARADAAVLPEEVLASELALREAVLKRYETTIQLERQIQAEIAAVLSAATTMVEMVTAVSQWAITSRSDFSTVTTLLTVLGEVATTASTAAARLWAVQQGLAAIIATLPTAVTANTFTSPSQITGAVIAGATPFLSAQQAAIDAATGATRFALLQQQAAQFAALANAAIAAINQWAEAAIKGARDAAAALIEAAQTEAARRIDVARTEAARRITVAQEEAARRQALLDAARDAALAAIDAQIAATQEAARLDQEVRRAQIDALSEQIAKAREFEAAIKAMGAFIQSLIVGPLGPGNPADKLASAQSAFAQALAAYNINPTAAGLTDLQSLAQTMLSLAEPIFSKPSPQFQALSATTIKQLEAAQALAKAQVTDSQILQSQLDALIAADKQAQLDAQAQLAALQEQREAITADFAQQTADLAAALEEYIGGIDTALEEYVTSIETGLADYVTSIETGLADTVAAIEQAAKDEIREINDALERALLANAAQQAELIGQQLAHEEALLAAVGDTAQLQRDTIDKLEEIRQAIVSAITGTPLARGADMVKEGLFYLHDNEAVLDARRANTLRSMGGLSALDHVRSAQFGAGFNLGPNALPNDLSNIGPYAPGSGDPLRDPWLIDNRPTQLWGGPDTPPAIAAELNRIEQEIMNQWARYNATVASNQYKMGGKIYQHQTAAELAALQATMRANIATLRAQQEEIRASSPPTLAPPPGGPPTPPPSVPPGPSWLSRESRTATRAATEGGVTLVIEQGAIAISGVDDPEEAAERAVKKLEERIVRGDLGIKILKRSRRLRP